MAHIRDRGKSVERRWQARYRDPSGQERSKTFERKIDAQRWLDEVTADLVTGRYVDPRAGRVTVGEWASVWLASQTFDAATMETMTSRIRTHILALPIGNTELRAVRPSTVQAWLRNRQAVLAASYVRLLLANLSTILQAAVEDRVIASNPATVSSVKAPRVDRRQVVPWTTERVHAVIDGHPADLAGVAVVAAGCGLRQGEAFGLEVDAVDFLGRAVRVVQQLRRVGRATEVALPKGGRTREVPLPDVVAVVLAEHMRIRSVTSGLLFSNRDGGPLTRAYFTHNGWRPALEAAGVEASRVNGMHALRHHYASLLLNEGVSIRAVSEYLGHHDPGFTLRTYAHLMPDAEDRARAAIDKVMGAPAEPSRNENQLGR
ncbi:hypothetical protein BH23ACT5_BH23ACT5_09980 [soil metagenome]